MKPEISTKIHNRFDIVRTNIETGIEEQIAYAENIVLDTMWPRLISRATYFSHINYGTGSGVLNSTRTGLFTYLGTRAAVDDLLTKEYPTASWRRKIVINPEEEVGAVISEVGIAYGAANNNLVTHALIRDMNGDVITITKTSVDVFTIYATVYINFLTSDVKLKICGLPNNNPLMNYLVGGTAFPSCYFYTGDCPQETQQVSNTLFGKTALGTSGVVTWTADNANKRMNSSTSRLGVSSSNGDVSEIGFGGSITTPIFRLTFPSTIYSGLNIVGENVGVGDGIRRSFRLNSMNIEEGNTVMKSDGVEVMNYVEKIEGDCTSVKTYVSSVGGLKNNGGVVKRINWARNALAMVCLSDTTPQVFDYSKVEEQFTSRGTVPAITGLTSVTLSGDGLLLAVSTTSSPYVRTFDWVVDTWVERANPVNLPAGAAYGCRISTDGLILAVTHATTPFVCVYDWVDSAWIKRVNPTELPTGVGSDIFLSGDALFMTIAHATTPFVTSYDWNGTVWVKRANPATLPASAGNRVSATEDGLVMAVRHATTPYVSVYDWTGSAWIKRVNPTILTAGIGVRLFSAGNGMVLTREDINYASIYLWDGIAWTKRTDVANIDGNSQGRDVDISYDEEIMTVGVQGTYGWADSFYTWGCKGYSTMIEFDTAPAVGAVITADYTVNGIYKTAQRVIDLSCSFTYGEPVVSD